MIMTLAVYSFRHLLIKLSRAVAQKAQKGPLKATPLIMQFHGTKNEIKLVQNFQSGLSTRKYL